MIKNKKMSKIKVFILNLVDARYWFCECGYYSPYGLVISADMCKNTILKMARKRKDIKNQ